MPSSPEDRSDVPEASSDDALFRAITESTSVGILLHRGGRIIFTNPAMARIMGHSREELLTMSFDEVAHPSCRDLVRERSLARLRGERVLSSYEFPSQSKAGDVKWLEVTASVIQYQGQSAVLATFIDFTARKRAEAAHKHTEWVLEQMLQGNPVATFVINEKHEVTHWNRACEAVTGLLAKDMVGTRRPWAAFYEDERPVLADLIVDGATEKLESYYKDAHHISAVVLEAYEAERFFPQLGKGGLWLHFTAAPLKDAKGKLIGAVETLVDITERKKSEESLRQAYEDLEVLVARRTGQLAQAKAALEADILKRQASEAELLQRYTELADLNAQLSSAQEQLMQSEKLASIGQLAAGVAHEINNPIGYVQSNIGTLENYLRGVLAVVDVLEEGVSALPADHPALQAMREIEEEHDLAFIREDALGLMEETREGIDRVRKIVADLKDFSRVDSAQVWQWADLHQCLDSTLNIVNNEIKYKAQVVKEYGKLPEVECMPSQINQVLMNLLVNASHAITAERGTITLRTGCEGDQVWVEVEDNGSGIPPDIQSKIFDPFFTTKPVGKGTGLGLSLSYGIMQKHHGSIEVRSQVGQGTVFRIKLPIKQTHKEEAAQ
ncbi:MAG: PAS domain S-box protein [Rhodocyclaceae bacterium]|nr:MAG: PAS domain S-box protein [Rhodocyclaceae bacterium]